MQDSDVWVAFHDGTYHQGNGKQLGVGDYTFSNGVFENGQPFKSVKLSPGACMMIDGCDVEWLGGLAGRDFVHVGYLDRMIGLACGGGHKVGVPSRIRITRREGPVVTLWRDDRYNNYHDCLTLSPGTEASGAHFMGGTAANWAMGVAVERDCTAYFYRSSHGGPSDPSPLQVVGPAEMRLTEGWSGWVNAARRVMHGYELVREEYDWNARRSLGSEDIVAARKEATNNGDTPFTTSVELSATESTTIEHHFGASLTTGVSVDVSAGVKPFGIGADVSVTASVESTVEASTGKSRSKETSVAFTEEVEVPPRSKKEVVVRLTKERCILPWKRTYKNKATGAEVVLTSDSEFERFYNAKTVVGAAVPLDNL